MYKQITLQLFIVYKYTKMVLLTFGFIIIKGGKSDKVVKCQWKLSLRLFKSSEWYL
jgi:hypothetical protein